MFSEKQLEFDNEFALSSSEKSKYLYTVEQYSVMGLYIQSQKVAEL